MSAESQSLKILLVEDEPLAILVHSRMLEELGYKPDVAETGKKALDLCVYPYDLILMDIGLPDTDGLLVTSEIRRREQEENKKRACIIAVTAYSPKDIKAKCFAAGMDEVTSKPIPSLALQSLITKHCRL